MEYINKATTHKLESVNIEKAASPNNKLDIKPILSKRCFLLLKVEPFSIDKNFKTIMIKAPIENIIGENLISRICPIAPNRHKTEAIM